MTKFKSRLSRWLRTGPPFPRWLLYPAIFAVLIGCVHLTYLVVIETDRSMQLKREVTRLQAEVDSYYAELEALRLEEEHGSDESYLEALARRAGFVYEHERRMVSPGNPAAGD